MRVRYVSEVRYKDEEGKRISARAILETDWVYPILPSRLYKIGFKTIYDVSLNPSRPEVVDIIFMDSYYTYETLAILKADWAGYKLYGIKGEIT